MFYALLSLANLAICWVYPMSQTFSAIENRNFSLFWITYWFIFGVLNYIEATLLCWLAP